MLTLTQQRAKLINVNPRSEIHGEDKKLAVDLSIEVKTSNDILSQFDPKLKATFYRPAEDGEDAQGDLLADQAPAGHMPKLVFPNLGRLKWAYNGGGYITTVHCGFSGDMDIRMIETDLDKFNFDCQDGGTVAMTFRVVAHPQPEELGRLCELIQQEITLTLEPPSIEKQLQRDLDAQRSEGE